uniref:BHLH domain-containing protein n=1 Tax=Oryza meridionalis TaxID=40149 RepID=A0A0E0EYE6_9ORYZ
MAAVARHRTTTTEQYWSQVPKVKLGDKITALQQIVSPFGKTDTASVLYEAINYIKWLHEQVQLLSDPYMKSSSSKDYNAWGGLDRKEKADAEVDLRSRGLCLVPVSCTPQVYRDNNGPDYWTPPYRSCLYR